MILICCSVGLLTIFIYKLWLPTQHSTSTISKSMRHVRKTPAPFVSRISSKNLPVGVAMTTKYKISTEKALELENTFEARRKQVESYCKSHNWKERFVGQTMFFNNSASKATFCMFVPFFFFSFFKNSI